MKKMYKRVLNVILTIIMLLTLIPVAVSAQQEEIFLPQASFATAWVSSASFANAPYFHGVTAITVPAGTTVNLRSGMFRTQAHDVFDGDITQSIVMPANTNITSNTTVTYSVTNSRGQTATQQVQITFSGTQHVIRRRIFSHPRADVEASEVADTRRGRLQCAQHLGIYMPPNSNFQARIIGGPAGQNLTIMGYAAIAGQNTDIVLNRNGTSVAVSHGNGVSGHGQSVTNMGRVPMVKTPINDTGHFDVELTFSTSGANSVRGLNYFNRGDNQTTFLNAWTSDHVFAVIESRTVTMLLPWNDRNELTGNPARPAADRMSSINEILDFFDDAVDKFNEWTGYTIDSALPINRLIRNRILVLPQFGGIGYAYAGDDHLAYSNGTTSVSGKPLTSGRTIYPYLIKSWANLHEIGHLFEGDMRNKEHNLVEIANNMLTEWYMIRHVRPTVAPGQEWRFDGTRTMTQLGNEWILNSTGNWPNPVGDFTPQRYVIMAFCEAAAGVERSTELWAEVNKLNRAMRANGQRWTLGDLFAQAAMDFSGYNMIPQLNRVGLHQSANVRANVFAQQGRMPYYLRRLTANDTSANTVRSRETLHPHMGLYASILPSTTRGITANATITISGSGLSSIAGQTLRIMDGPNIIREATIPANGIVSLTGLPIGAYAVDLPSSGNFLLGHHALLVREGTTNNLTIQPTRAPLNISRVRVNSWEATGGDKFFPTSLFDGSPLTFWHARWNQGSGHRQGESFVDIDLGGVRTVDRIEVDRRVSSGQNIRAVRMFTHAEQGNVFPNGERIPADFPANVAQSDIDADFIMTGWNAASPQISGTNTANPVILTLSTPITTRYIRLGITNGPVSGAADFTQVSQVRVFGEGQPPSTIVSVNPNSLTVDRGQNRTSQVTVQNGQGNTTATSNNTAVATATISGNTVTVTGVSQGTTTVTVRNNNVTATIAVTVADPDVQAIITQLGDVIVSKGANNAAVLANFRGTRNGTPVALQVNGNIDFNRPGEYTVTIAPVIGSGSLSGVTVRVVEDAVYVGDFGWTPASTVGWLAITADFGVEPAGSPLLLTGAGSSVLEYRKGILAHATSNVIFDVAGKDFTEFRGYVGINRLASGARSTTGTTIFEVWVDGERRFTSGSMSGNTSAIFANVDITDANIVELRAVANSNGNAHATWADAMFIRDGEALPPPAWGDVDGNGFINAADITMLRRYLAAENKQQFRAANTGFVLRNAYVRGAYDITLADVILLQLHIAATDPATVPLGSIM